MLNEIEKKQLARYESLMAMPKWKYIIIYGMIAWGLTVGILVTIINLLLFHKDLNETLSKDLWINLIGFPVGGIFFGMYMRNFMPRQIKRLKEKMNQP